MIAAEHLRSKTRATFFIALVFAACGETEPRKAPASALPSSTTNDIGSAPLATCTPGPTRCLDAATLEICSDGGAISAQACEPDATCVGRRCMALVDPRGVRVPRTRARGPSEEGFFNAWSGHVGVAKKAADAFLETGEPRHLGAERVARPVCAHDGYVVATRAIEGPRPDGAAVLTGLLFSDAPREVEVRAGVAGKLAVRFGAQVLRFEEMPGREGRALVDERFATVMLPEGPIDVAAIVEPPSAGFYLRLVEPSGEAARVAFSERFDHAACPTRSLFDVSASYGVKKDGLWLSTRPRFRGWIPATSEAAGALGVDVVSPKGEVLHTVTLETSASNRSRREAPRLEAKLEPPQKGRYAVRLRLGDELLLVEDRRDQQEAIDRVAALVEAAGRIEKLSLPQASRDSFSHHVGVLADAVGADEPDKGWLERHIKVAEGLRAKLDQGIDAYTSLRGVVFRAYRSPLDGQLQPYVAFVPRSQGARGPEPMVVVAHGRDRLPAHALRTVFGEAPDEHMTLSFAARNFPPFPDLGAIVVAPWGYGNAGVQGVGEEDVLRVIEEMKAAYGVDDRRVSITGYSLGGTVSFALPFHYPDRFAASAPLCGYPNLLGYRSVAQVPHAAWEDALLSKEYLVRYAENGRHVPLHVVHGGLDVPGRSKVVIDRYKELGYSYLFDAPAELDHNVWDHGYEGGRMISWLRRSSAPRAPKQVRFVTGKYRYDRAYWVKVLGIDDTATTARAEVDAAWDPTVGVVTVKTKNVNALSIDTRGLDPLPALSHQIRIDQDSLPIDAPREVFLQRDAAGHWSQLERAPDRSGLKRHGVSGPLDDVQRHPVSIVYGTLDPAHRDANQRVAEHLATLGESASIRYPVIADVDASDEILAGRSVILVGGTANNQLTAAVQGLLPVSFEPAAIVLRGQRYEGSDVAVSLIFPGPEAFAGPGSKVRASSDRYVVIHAGLSPRATLASRFLPRYLPDYVVYDAGLAVERGGLLFGTRPVRAAGFFSESWQ